MSNSAAGPVLAGEIPAAAVVLSSKRPRLVHSGADEEHRRLVVHPLSYETNFSYQDQWTALLRSDEFRSSIDRSVVLYDVAFYEHYSPSSKNKKTKGGGGECLLLMVACASNGCLYVWRVPSKDEAEEEEEREGSPGQAATTSWRSKRPRYCWKLSENGDASAAWYQMKFHSRSGPKKQETIELVCTGEGGVALYDWAQLLQQADSHLMAVNSAAADPSSPQPSFPVSTPPASSFVARFRPHALPYCSGISPAQQQQLAIRTCLVEDGHLYAAVDETDEIYKWNLSSHELIRVYKPGKSSASCIRAMTTTRIPTDLSSDDLHAPDSSDAPTTTPSSVLLAGGDDGLLTLWDYENDRQVETIDINTAIPDDDSQQQKKTTKFVARSKPSVSHRKSIACIAATQDGNWWVVAGTRLTRTATATAEASQSEGGYVASFYAPTRSLVAYEETLETPNRLKFLGGTNVVSVANEAVVTRRQCPSLHRVNRVCCQVPCAYSIALAPPTQTPPAAPTDELVAIGGVGGTVDLFDGTEQTYRFTCW